MKYALLFLLPVVLSSCFGYKEVSLREVRSVELRRIDDHGVSFTVEAVINNPNDYRIKARDPDVDLFVNGKPMGKATIDSVLTLDKHSERSYFVPVTAIISGDQLTGIVLAGMLTGRVMLRAQGSMVGQVGLFRRRFPFELEQEVELDQ
jgi:LEA14-like dessication related protein